MDVELIKDLAIIFYISFLFLLGMSEIRNVKKKIDKLIDKLEELTGD